MPRKKEQADENGSQNIPDAVPAIRVRMICVTHAGSVGEPRSNEYGERAHVVVHREVVYALTEDGNIHRSERKSSGVFEEWEMLPPVPSTGSQAG